MPRKPYAFGRIAASVIVGVMIASSLPAYATRARCFTSDDGSYTCEFRRIGRNGSFEISARGKPTYTLEVIEPGVAFGHVTLGKHGLALPGRYLRDRMDPACWVNDSTAAKICSR
jgi:hypothetical protein